MIKSSRVRSAAAILALGSLVAFSSTSHAAATSTPLNSLTLTQEQVANDQPLAGGHIIDTRIWRGIVTKKIWNTVQLSSAAPHTSAYRVALPDK